MSWTAPGADGLLLEVGDQVLGEFDTVMQVAQGSVAIHAEQAADALAAGSVARTASVVVVDAQPHPARGRVPAYGAGATLALQEPLVLLAGDVEISPELPGQLPVLGCGVPVAFEVIAGTAHASRVYRPAAALADSPLGLWPRNASGTHLHLGAFQRVLDHAARNALHLRKLNYRLSAFIERGYLGVFFWAEARSST